MSLSKYIPSKHVVSECDLYRLKPCVIFAEDLPGKFVSIAQDMCKGLLAETMQMRATSATLRSYNIIVAIGDAAVLVMRRASNNKVYETHYEAVHPVYAGTGIARCLFDLAAEVALFDAACRIADPAIKEDSRGGDWISKAVAEADAYVAAMMKVGEIKMIARVTVGPKANAMERHLWAAYTLKAETRVTHEMRYERTVAPNRDIVEKESMAAMHVDISRWPSASHRRIVPGNDDDFFDVDAAIAGLALDEAGAP